MCVFGDILDVLPAEVRRSLDERVAEKATCHGVSRKQVVNKSLVVHYRFFLRISVLRKTWPWQVYITKLDLLKALHGGHQTDEAVLMASSKTISTKTFEKVLTQTKVLKRSIGSAHKGWQLDGSVNAEGLCAFLHGTSSKFKLTLSRRTLRQTYLDFMGCA